MTNGTGRLAREIMAVLESDLRTSRARTDTEVLRAARASLDSLRLDGQIVVVGSCPSRPGRVSVEVDGPALVGFVSLRV